MSHAIQNVAFAVNNLLQQQHSKVIKPTKRFKSTFKSTAKVALCLPTKILYVQHSKRW